MRDDLETRVKQLEGLLLEVQNENAKLRDLIVNPKWEYVRRLASSEDADKYGSNGWELATAVVQQETGIMLIFKRRVKG